MTRKILYYPSILIPPDWIRGAILYWDKISSIMPKSFEDAVIEGKEEKESINVINELKEEGVFTASRPYKAFYHEINNRTLNSEFMKIIESSMYDNNKEYYAHWEIYDSKLQVDVIRFLQEKGLISKLHENDRFIYVEAKAAQIYMSLLAKYIANSSPDYTIISTDDIVYQDYNFIPLEENNLTPTFKVDFLNFLPFPHADTPIKKILKFKKNHRDELLRFRMEMDTMYEKISASQSQEELKHNLVKFSESKELGINDIEKAMKYDNILYELATSESLLKIGAPAILTYLAQQGLNIQQPLTAVATGVAGLVRIGTIYTRVIKNKNDAMTKSPFAYLYNAKKKNII